jgi:hypothetical protein
MHNWCRWKGLGLERVLSIISTGLGHCGLRQLRKSPKIPQNMIIFVKYQIKNQSDEILTDNNLL